MKKLFGLLFVALVLTVSCGETERVVLTGIDGLDGSGCTILASIITCGDTEFNLDELRGEDGKIGPSGGVGPAGPQGEPGVGIPGEPGSDGIDGQNATYRSFNIPVGSPGACVNIQDGQSARLYKYHSEANYVTKVYLTSNCSGTYVATLWPNDDDSDNSGDEVAFVEGFLLIIESLRNTGAYTLYKISFGV